MYYESNIVFQTYIVVSLTFYFSVINVSTKKETSIEDITALQFEKVIENNDYVAVFWYKKSSKESEKILAELETIDDDSENFGVEFVKVADKKLAKSHGVNTLPALSFFRRKEPIHFEGDLMDEESVLKFLTSLEAMELPDQIEDVNAKVLDKVIQDQDFVAVLFYKTDCRSCSRALTELENIDDDADQLGIAFVKINDQDLADEYSLGSLPALVYYRRRIPVVYDGDLLDEDKVLEWLVENKSTGDDEDRIEDVTIGLLNTLIDSMDHLAVIVFDQEEKDQQKIIEKLENIDDDLDREGIHIVKISDDAAEKNFGIERTPALVYFENEIPSLFYGDIEQEEEVLSWLINQKQTDEIEEVTDEMLDKLIKESQHLAVLFYDESGADSQQALSELENIDDECDSHEIVFVKIDDKNEAKGYGIENFPTLVYFEKMIPSVYSGSLFEEQEVLKWLIHQTQSDEIEDVTDEMLDYLVEKTEKIVVLFYDRTQRKSNKVLSELENIDDECDANDIAFVKISDVGEASEYGIENLPTLVYFENEVPYVYKGDLMKEEEVLSWTLHHSKNEELADVNAKVLRKLISGEPHVAVVFYDSSDPDDSEMLTELENIDANCEQSGIPMVKIGDQKEAKLFGIDKEELPTLVYFEDGIPSIYEGDLSDEMKVLEWLIDQKNSETIEKVSDEILKDLVNNFAYVLVYFSGPCEEDEKCDDILDILENIDDDSDDLGMHFVTTEDTKFASKNGITNFPAIALFRDGQPVTYKGKMVEQNILNWITSDEALEIPNQIEEVNVKMLEKLINISQNIAVFFYMKGERESSSILQELEQIDDECDDINIDFVKIHSSEAAKNFQVEILPSLVFFKNKFPSVYKGNLHDKEALLEWLIDAKDQGPASVIKEMNGQILRRFIEDFNFVVVYFYDHNCPTCETTLTDLETIDDEALEVGIEFVKTSDVDIAQEFGISHLPALVYFEGGVPSIYDDDISNEEKVLNWLIEQRNEDTIENINRQILYTLIDSQDYLLVYFYNEMCEDCPKVIRALEKIDDEASEFGIQMVKMNDRLMAKKYGFRNPPGLAYFRRGKHIVYQGDHFDEEDILDWITAPENMELNDAIEKVNRKMFERLKQQTEYLAVFFYSDENCRQCAKVLSELETIDDELDSNGIDFVKLDDRELANEIGVFALPAIVFFRQSADQPLIYAGDMKNEENILSWFLTEKDPAADFIEETSGSEVQKLIKESDAVAVFFYNEGTCDDCMTALRDLEDIDDETDKLGVKFVKTQDSKVAEKYGVRSLPALIYFQHNLPTVYEGDLTAEEEVLQWLILQKTEDRIETINRNMLETMLSDTQYLAVLFYKPNCRACEQILSELENIDDECDLYGIHMVKIQDPTLAKRYGIKTLPALIYFRNGNPLIYEGDFDDEKFLLEWLTDEENRELSEEIENINTAMMDLLLEQSAYLAVLFYEDDCDDCDKVLHALENIDDEVDMYGIDFVKINDPDAAIRFNVVNTPTLVYFRKKIPIVYDGDLMNEEKVFKWLTSQDIFGIKDEIEDVNRKMLEKLVEEHEFVAVYFYEEDCPKCDEALSHLEKIDSSADDLDIVFVKIKDSKYAKKYGMSKLPALVCLRRKFPSIYRGDLSSEKDVLDWLQKGRFKSVELNIFMYAIFTIIIAFVMYTLFLIFFFNKSSSEK